MIGIVVATRHEASTIIKYLDLKKQDSKFEIFANSNTALIISGVGKYNAVIASTHILSINNIKILYNIGIAGSSKTHDIGSMFLINKIEDVELKRDFYPDILLQTPIPQCSIETHNSPVDKKTGIKSRLVDMESSAVFMSGIKFLAPNNILFLKIVSDNLEPNLINKEFVYALFEQNINMITEIIQNYSFKKKRVYHQSILGRLSLQLKLTKTQKIELDNYIKYYVLNDGEAKKLLKKVIPDIKSREISKKEFAKLKHELLQA
jgi:nucleoside phosphorylase